MTYVVLGGAGELGRAVISSLAARGLPVRPASRRTGVDLQTGARVRTVVSDAEVILHLASDPMHAREVDLAGTRRMIEILADLGRRPHLVFISIVGVDRIRYPYYRAKFATEIALRRSGLPVTVLRATQFHSLVAELARRFTVGPAATPLALVPRGLRSDGVATTVVAERLVEIALGPAPDGFVRSRDLGGPATIGLAEAVARLARHEGRAEPRMLPLPAVTPFLRDFAAGGNLLGPDGERAGPDFGSWLRRQT